MWFVFFLMIRRPPRSTLFPTRRSSDLKDHLGEATFALLDLFDISDFVGVEGPLFRTRTGEVTIRVDRIELLAKSLRPLDRKSTRLNSSHLVISYAVLCLQKTKHTHMSV